MPVVALCLVVILIALPFLGPALSWQPYTTFKAFAGLLLASTLLALVSLGVILWGLMQPGQGQLVYALTALVIALLPALAAVVYIGPANLRAPLIHDISTDLEDPPRFQRAAELRRPGQHPVAYGGEAVAAKQREAYPDIEPLISPLSPQQALQRARQVMLALGWEFTASRFNAIEATATSRVFGFVDDVIVRVSPHPEGSRIDLRSASRVGRGDLGANARRIRRFRDRFESAEQAEDLL